MEALFVCESHTRLGGVCPPRNASSFFKKPVIDLKETSLTAWSGLWEASGGGMGGRGLPVCEIPCGREAQGVTSALGAVRRSKGKCAA